MIRALSRGKSSQQKANPTSSAEGLDDVRGPIGREGSFPRGDPGVPPTISRGSPETEMERGREARPRPEVEEKKRPFQAAPRPVGGKNGKETLEDGECEPRIEGAALGRRPQVRDHLGKASTSLIEAHPHRGAGYGGEAPKNGDGMVTHRPGAFRRESPPRSRRGRKRKTTTRGCSRPPPWPSRGTGRSTRTCCRCCTDRGHAFESI